MWATSSPRTRESFEVTEYYTPPRDAPPNAPHTVKFHDSGVYDFKFMRGVSRGVSNDVDCCFHVFLFPSSLL